MEPGQVNAVVRFATTTKFDAADVAIVEIDGTPFWSAREIGGALGYAQADQIAITVAGSWSDELAEGTDYRVVRGEDLAAVKAAAPGLVDARAPSLLMLTESGVHLVCLLSRQPRAKALRRWLAEEVLPSLRRTGRYDPLEEDHDFRLGLVLERLPEELAEAPARAVLELLAMEALSGRRLEGLRRSLSGALPALSGPTAAPASRRTSFELAFPTAAHLERFLAAWFRVFGEGVVDLHMVVAHPGLEEVLDALPWTEPVDRARRLGLAFRCFHRFQPPGWRVAYAAEPWQAARWSVRPAGGAL